MTQAVANTDTTALSPYSRRGLALLFFWLLGGDFAFTFFEQIFARFMPIYLKDLQASNTLIGVLTGSIAGLVNIFFLPNISIASDRHRGRLGRRIPFLLLSMPLAVLALICVGVAPELGSWLHATCPWLPMTANGVILILLSVFVVAYHFWNMVLVNAYNWLLRDVVPPPLMARFLAWFRIVSQVAGFIFLWYVFPQAVNYRKTMFLGIGLTYAAIFLLMCWQVKEPKYPPPPQNKSPGLIKTFLSYFRECLVVPLYRNFFLAYVLLLVGTSCSGPFLTLFARNTLGLSMEDMGRVFAWSTLVGAVAYVPMSWACDKFGAMRVTISGLAGLALVPLFAFFLVENRNAWLAYSVAFAIPGIAWALGSAVLMVELFPAEKFGQLSAGVSVFGMGGLIAGNFLAGVFMDWTHSNYRLMFLWPIAFVALALLTMMIVYRHWRQYEGPHHSDQMRQR